jgi:hypothetical protein
MTRMCPRLLEEMRKVVIATLYLYVCFAAILLYRMATLHAYGVEYAPWGVAAIKALVLAKFILIGRATGLGNRYQHRPLIYPILHQSVLFVIMLIMLSIAEEVIKGFFHGQSFMASVSDVGTALQIVSVTLLLWLVLLPYLGMVRLNEYLGDNKLRRMLLG